jgi:hypothetical protein
MRDQHFERQMIVAYPSLTVDVFADMEDHAENLDG